MTNNIYNLPYFLMVSLAFFIFACAYAYAWSGYFLQSHLVDLCYESVNPLICIQKGI